MLLCLAPFCPHICEELWRMMGNSGLLAKAKWPAADGEALTVDSVTVVLQINGKLREQFKVAPGMSHEELTERVMSEDAVKRRIEGMEVVKIIAVPDKLVNIVVKG
jgi:leucyl-tRNA synthetase